MPYGVNEKVFLITNDNMKVNEITFLLVVIAFLVSCTVNNNTVDELFIKGQMVNINENEGKDITCVFGNRAYARDRKANVYSGELSVEKLMRYDRLFESGHGHNEFGMVALSQGYDGSLYILDRPFAGMKLLSLTKIKHVDEISCVKNQTEWERYDLDKLPSFFTCGDTFEVLSDSTILVTGTPADDLKHVLSIVDFKNQTVTPLNYWPDDDIPDKSINDKLIVYTEYTGIEGNGKGRFLYWNNSGLLAFIFTIDGKKMNILKNIYNEHLPIPDVDKTPSTERVFCCSNSDRIYLLYLNCNEKGEKIEKFDMKDPFPMGNIVEVYNWNGEKLNVIHLDRFGRNIYISGEGKTLYLYTSYMNDENQYMYSYDLSSLK